MQERYIATADLGTSKIALSVAKVIGEDIQIIYYRETPSDGIRYSCVFNPMKVQKALKDAITTAEQELKIRILQIVVGLPRYNVHQEIASARIDRSSPDSCISQEEVDTLKSMAIQDYPLDDAAKEEIYGAVAQSFSVDDLFQANEMDIVGTTSEVLEGNFKVFVGKKKSSSNIDVCLNGLGVAPAKKVFLPHAVAGAVLTSEEKENGVALIEIGAGVTSLTIYQGRIMRYYAAIPFGGRNVTSDIKYECGFGDSLAENIKFAFGACMPEKLLSMSEKIIRINDDETGGYEQLPVKYLSEIITSRTKEIFDTILYLIQASGFAERLRSGVVLTGGGANLANIATLLKEMSGYNVRMGYPRRYFSSSGCSGIGETGAVASVGMILQAARDPYLNCIEEAAQATEEEAAEAPVEVISYKDTVFEEPLEETPAAPRKTKPAKPEKQKNSIGTFFIKKVKDKFTNMIDKEGGLFSQTYDTME